MKLLVFIGVTVFSSLGWWAGERFAIMSAFIASSLRSIFGVYAGWWCARRLWE